MASAYADMLDVSFGFVSKRRKDAINVEALNLVGEVDGREVLIVDDLTESGGTLLAAAELAHKHGATKIRAAVSHPVLNETGYERYKNNGVLTELITTDSTPVETRGLPITVLSVSKLLGEAIKRINNNQSVTSLFKIKRF